jgi:hypothetical protein
MRKNLDSEREKIQKRYSFSLLPGIMMNAYSVLKSKTFAEDSEEHRRLSFAFEENKKRLDGVLEFNFEEPHPSIRVKNPQIKDIIEHAEKILSDNHANQRLLHESALIMGVGYVEALVSSIAWYYLTANEGTLTSSDNHFTYKDLLAINNIEEARDQLIETKIMEITSGSMIDWIKFIKKSFCLTSTYMDDFSSNIKEIGLRRNLLVHNAGIVNALYFRNVPDNIKNDIALGKRLNVSSKYFLNMLDILQVAFVLLACEVWSKRCNKEEKDDIAVFLVSESYDALCEKRWSVARSFAKFAASDKDIKEFTRLMASVNLWQSYKWSGEFNEVKEEVEKWETDTLNFSFQLARAALLDEKENFFTLLELAVTAKQILSWQAYEWPIFQKMREDEHFEKILREKGLEPSLSHDMLDDDSIKTLFRADAATQNSAGKGEEDRTRVEVDPSEN